MALHTQASAHGLAAGARCALAAALQQLVGRLGELGGVSYNALQSMIDAAWACVRFEGESSGPVGCRQCCRTSPANAALQAVMRTLVADKTASLVGRWGPIHARKSRAPSKRR